MLAARVERGWEPTPTAMKGGAEVLGHAACLAFRQPTRANTTTE